ncbi:hypothetical protein LSH36_5g18057 [Paralvinella palmiformis]|uniref:C-type lectin domain-containing protein n=1 Tax=Paralvinella palmiformis TaxID=53620 RepID=A0AAD9KEX5_9ANNE|nr:hypothetical protein LSH36_5g18057 [Paralvinella palmiformis]
MCHSQNGYTWFSARNKCLQGNGDLISFDDVEVANGVISRIEHEMGSTEEVMWIGLTRELWAWTLRNGTRTITYSYWDQGEPYKPERRANCLALESGNGPTTWRSLDCNTALGAVLCQATNNRSSTTRRTLNDTSDDTNQTENSKTNVKSTWLKDDMTILMLSIASAIIFILLLVIVSLIICLRNARRINVLLGSKPKTYFDYFDLGFRRKLPTMAPSSEHNRTVVLTNDMLTSSNRDGNQVGNDDHS